MASLALCFMLYALFGWRIAQGAFLDHWNLLFDLDSGAYMTLLTRPMAEMFEDTLGAVKHPLLTWARLVAEPWLIFGLSDAQAACMSIATISTFSVFVFWHCLRIAGAGWIDAMLATTLFAIGATQLFYGFLPESYPFAGLTLLLVTYFGFRRIQAPGSVPVVFGASAIAAFGVTVTNVVVAGIMDMAGRLHAAWPSLTPDRRLIVLRRLFFEQIYFGAICGVIAAAMILFTWWEPLLAAADDPIGALKRIYWTQTKGEVTSFSTVLLTFFGYAFAAPNFTVVAIPEHAMLDFRNYDMGPVWTIALPVWILCWVGLAAAALKSRQTRVFAIALAGCILFNLILHSGFQFRLSVFLYSGHSWLLIALIAGLGLTAASDFGPLYIRLVRISLTILIALVALNNLPRAWQAATAFDQYPPSSPIHQSSNLSKEY